MNTNDPQIMEFTAEQIIRSSIADAINRFVNQGLTPADVLDKQKWRAYQDSKEFYAIRNEIADSIAAKWGEALKKRTERH